MKSGTSRSNQSNKSTTTFQPGRPSALHSSCCCALPPRAIFQASRATDDLGTSKEAQMNQTKKAARYTVVQSTEGWWILQLDGKPVVGATEYALKANAQKQADERNLNLLERCSEGLRIAPNQQRNLLKKHAPTCPDNTVEKIWDKTSRQYILECTACHAQFAAPSLKINRSVVAALKCVQSRISADHMMRNNPEEAERLRLWLDSWVRPVLNDALRAIEIGGEDMAYVKENDTKNYYRP